MNEEKCERILERLKAMNEKLNELKKKWKEWMKNEWMIWWKNERNESRIVELFLSKVRITIKNLSTRPFLISWHFIISNRSIRPVEKIPTDTTAFGQNVPRSIGNEGWLHTP